MHKALSAAELAEVEKQHPVRPLTKPEKLAMWAALVEKHPRSLHLFSNLEAWTPKHLEDLNLAAQCATTTAIGLALTHEPFKAEGIGGTIGSALRFFELTRHELHEFSCDCGGYIDNKEQARRIGNLARGNPSLMERVSSALDTIF